MFHLTNQTKHTANDFSIGFQRIQKSLSLLHLMARSKSSKRSKSRSRSKSKSRSYKSVKLCKRGISAAKAVYKRYPSAYANGYASLVCQGRRKDLSGKMRADKRYVRELNAKPNKSTTGLSRWFKEKWVNVCEKDSKGRYKSCGRSKAKMRRKSYPYCRPSVRVTSQTPKTVGEMTKAEIKRRCKRKRSISAGKRLSR